MAAQERLEDSRIYGRRRIWVIYVHLAKKDTALPNVVAPVGYSLAVTKKKPQILSDLGGLISVGLGGAKQAERALAPTDPVGYYYAQRCEIDFPTSTIDVTARTASDEAKTLGKHAFTNERKYNADFSFAFPLNSYRDLDLSGFDNGVQPKKTDRQNIYAVVDFYLPAIDIARPEKSPIPHLLFGVPIKSKPLRNTMLGLGWALPWAEPFIGVVFDIQQIPNAAGTDSEDHTVTKVIFGLNVPVSTAKKIRRQLRGDPSDETPRNPLRIRRRTRVRRQRP